MQEDVLSPNLIAASIQPSYQFLVKSPKWPWPSARRALVSTLLLPFRILFFPITLPLEFAVTRVLTTSGKHYSRPRQGQNAETEKGKWFSYRLRHHPNKEEHTGINVFKLHQSTKKLHINVHGVESSATEFDEVMPVTAEQFNADQWAMTRHASWHIESQKRQLRRVLALAIQEGYKDIRLDGFSYGAGLVRTVYHEIIRDEKYRNYLSVHGIALHYTARNGYISEGMTVGGYLTGHGLMPSSEDYVNNAGKTPKPNFVMWTIHILCHWLSFIDFSLRNRELNGRTIPANSRNYVVSSVVSGTRNLKRDGIITLHNRSSHIEKYGHVCLDIAAATVSPQDTNHVIGLQTDVFKEANNQIKRDLEQNKDSAKYILDKIKQTIIDTRWKTKKGPKIQVFDQNKGEMVERRVPKHVKKQWDTMTKGKITDPVQLLLQVRAMGKKGREKSYNQKARRDYYETFREVATFYRTYGAPAA